MSYWARIASRRPLPKERKMMAPVLGQLGHSRHECNSRPDHHCGGCGYAVCSCKPSVGVAAVLENTTTLFGVDSNHPSLVRPYMFPVLTGYDHGYTHNVPGTAFALEDMMEIQRLADASPYNFPVMTAYSHGQACDSSGSAFSLNPLARENCQSRPFCVSCLHDNSGTGGPVAKREDGEMRCEYCEKQRTFGALLYWDSDANALGAVDAGKTPKCNNVGAVDVGDVDFTLPIKLDPTNPLPAFSVEIKRCVEELSRVAHRNKVLFGLKTEWVPGEKEHTLVAKTSPIAAPVSGSMAALQHWERVGSTDICVKHLGNQAACDCDNAFFLDLSAQAGKPITLTAEQQSAWKRMFTKKDK